MTRIISGAAGSLRLEVPKAGTRPTSDRVREAIFSALQSWGFDRDYRVLDLYAGSGALGLEALSRGASAATLVERHSQAAQVASRNAKTVLAAFSDAARPEAAVIRSSVQSYLEQARVEQSHGEGTDRPARFDVVFIDPPYDLAESELGANLLALAPLLDPRAVVLVERSTRSPEPGWPAALTRIREKRYGETVLWWAEPTAQ